MKRTVILGLAALAVLLAVAVAALFANSSPGSTGLLALGPTSDTIKVGWIGPLSGDQAELGIPNKQGIEIAVKEINAAGGINGRKIEVLFEDERSSGPGEAISAFQKLVGVDNAKVVFVEKYSQFLSLVPVAEQSNVLAINCLDTSEELAGISENAFAIGIYDEGIGETLAEFAANELNAESAAIIFKNDEAFTVLVKNGFVGRFEELGGEVKASESYHGFLNDFRSVLLKTEAQEPEVLVVLGYDETGFALRQAREMGIEATFLGADLFSSQTFFRNSGSAAAGAYFTFWEPDESALSRKFLDDFKKEFGKEPEQILFTATGYDSMKMVAEAMKNCENPESVDCVREELRKIKDLQGLTGKLTMSQDNIVRSVREEIYVMEADGSFHPLE